MRPEVLKYLYDVLQALDAIDEICDGAAYEKYTGSITLRSAVERQFEIAGEALSQMGKSTHAPLSESLTRPRWWRSGIFLFINTRKSTPVWCGV